MGDDDFKRRKGSDKRKDTFNKYGKNTERGMRHKLASMNGSATASGGVEKKK